MTEPFNPFSFEQDVKCTQKSLVILPGEVIDDSRTRSGAGSRNSGSRTNDTSQTNDTAKTNNTKDYRLQQRHQRHRQHKHLHEIQEHRHTKTLAIPPRLHVRLSLHEEVSSTAILESVNQNGGEGGSSMSQLFIEGKVVVSVALLEVS